VRGLMNSRAAISGFVRPWAASRATCVSCVVSSSTVSTVRFAHCLAGGRKLALSALGERSRAHSAEHLVGSAQLLARVDAAVLATQPLAVQQAAARELERRAAARETLDRFAVERLVVAQQSPAARFDPERPFGAARPRAFAQAVERRDGFVRPPAADAGLDQFDQGPSVKTTSSCSKACRAAVSASPYWPCPLCSNAVSQ